MSRALSSNWPVLEQLRHLCVSARPVLSMNRGILVHGDCTDLFAALKDESIDCVFADPPFNLSKDYGNGAHHDNRSARAYLDWSYRWLDEAVRVLKVGGSIFIYILPRWGYHLAFHLERNGLEFRHWIALSMKGTFPRGRKLYPAHYAILYFSKGVPKTFNRVRLPIPTCRHCGGDIKDYGGHRKYLNPAGLNLTDFWDDTAPARHSKFKTRWHINELKPIIPSRCIAISTNDDDIVLDPFGGGGSTYQAAQEMNRFWIGSELVTADAIVKRMQERFPLVCGMQPSDSVLDSFKRRPDAQDHRRSGVQRRARKNRATGARTAAS